MRRNFDAWLYFCRLQLYFTKPITKSIKQINRTQPIHHHSIKPKQNKTKKMYIVSIKIVLFRRHAQKPSDLFRFELEQSTCRINQSIQKKQNRTNSNKTKSKSQLLSVMKIKFCFATSIAGKYSNANYIS